MKILEKQTHRFILVGISNAIISITSYLIFIHLGIYYISASLMSHIIGITNSFIWNKTWTFKSKGKLLPEYIKFNSVYVLTYIINLILLILLVETLNVNTKAAGVGVLIIISIISFLGHKYWSFKNNDTDKFIP